VLVKTVRCIIW